MYDFNTNNVEITLMRNKNQETNTDETKKTSNSIDNCEYTQTMTYIYELLVYVCMETMLHTRFHLMYCTTRIVTTRQAEQETYTQYYDIDMHSHTCYHSM